MEETQIATAEEVVDQEPKSIEAVAEDSKAKILEDFMRVLAAKSGKQAIKAFLTQKATVWLTAQTLGTITRKQRRKAARQVAKRLTKRVIAGEEIF